jgi:2-iminobutanoate/2-iminopropanoate deaminase
MEDNKMLPIHTNKAPAAVGPYSQAAMKGNMVFVSGTLGIDPVTGVMPEGFAEQATLVFSNLKAILEMAAMNFSHVVKVSIFILDMGDFAVLNELYAENFREPYPARETVQVSRLPKDGKVEISLIAMK